MFECCCGQEVLHGTDLIGEWTVPQLSAVTGDAAARAFFHVRLSIPTCKAAFFASQQMDQLGAGRASEASAQTTAAS